MKQIDRAENVSVLFVTSQVSLSMLREDIL